MSANGPAEERFYARVAMGPNGCHQWTGGLGNNGYGKIHADGYRWLAHRYAYTLTWGAIPSGMILDHLCRNRGCVNPDHLEPVTYAENARRGETGHHWRAKREAKVALT